jgi:hypothetical protein
MHAKLFNYAQNKGMYFSNFDQAPGKILGFKGLTGLWSWFH